MWNTERERKGKVIDAYILHFFWVYRHNLYDYTLNKINVSKIRLTILRDLPLHYFNCLTFSSILGYSYYMNPKQYLNGISLQTYKHNKYVYI